MQNLTETWVYLAQSPLLWLTLTLAVYQGASWLYRRMNSTPFLNPIIPSVVILVGLLLVTRTPYEAYFDGAQFIHFLLGPAIVALAVPLYNNLKKLTQMFVPVSGALLVGSLVGILTSVGLGWLLGLPPETLRSLAPRSITTPIAMGVSEQIGGWPSLTAVLVVLTGITGALIARKVLDLIRVREPGVRGFALGLSSHGLGTATAFQKGEETGAFAGLAMGLNGAVTAILLPVLARLIGLG